MDGVKVEMREIVIFERSANLLGMKNSGNIKL